MSKPFATLVPALQGKDPHATAAQIFHDLGWQQLDRCPPREPAASPPLLPPVETTFLLAHPSYGIALVDIAPDCAVDPVGCLQRRLRLLGFATGSVPILHFSLTADDVWRIPTIIDPAFALQPPMAPPGPGWIGRVQEALLLTPPEPAPPPPPLPAALAPDLPGLVGPILAPPPALPPAPPPAPPAAAALSQELPLPSALPTPQRHQLNPVWVLLAVGLLSGGAMLQYGRIEADRSAAPPSSTPEVSTPHASTTRPSTPEPATQAEALGVLPVETLLAGVAAPLDAPGNPQAAPLREEDGPRANLAAPSRETEAAAAQPPADELSPREPSPREPLPEADAVLVDLFQPPAEREQAASAKQAVEEPVAPPLAAPVEAAPSLEEQPIERSVASRPPVTVAPAAGPAAPQPATAPAALDPRVVNLLVGRGNEMLARGDMSAARLLFARAADAGSAAAALAMARSFDPAVLATLGAPGIRPDPAAAEHWYRRAAELGAR